MPCPVPPHISKLAQLWWIFTGSTKVTSAKHQIIASKCGGQRNFKGEWSLCFYFYSFNCKIFSVSFSKTAELFSLKSSQKAHLPQTIRWKVLAETKFDKIPATENRVFKHRKSGKLLITGVSIILSCTEKWKSGWTPHKVFRPPNIRHPS